MLIFMLLLPLKATDGQSAPLVAQVYSVMVFPDSLTSHP